MEIITTMITPYHADGSVDYENAERYVDWYYENGLDGIFAVCQSGEIFFLSLEERVELNRRVYKRAKELEKGGERPFTVVSSGHVSDTVEEQAKELSAIYETGTDALILITNRLDLNNEGDEVWIKNAEKLLSMLPAEAKLGLYECPYPYKRLVTPKILNWCLSTGRFYYMKDTCCDAELIKERCAQLAGSHFKLLNANGQTLLQSLRDGAQGYCGVMANYHPALYAWLGHHFETEPETAEFIQGIIGTFCFTEGGLPYPLSAKYHMNLCDIPTENIGRSRKSEELTDYHRLCLRQMKLSTDKLERWLEEQK